MLKTLILLAIIFTFPSTAFSQADNKEENLKGFSPEQIAEKLGKPDKINSISKSQSQWIYGQSIVFFQDNVVIAWSDNGDLDSRQNLAKIRDSSKSDDYIKKWKNPWTPREQQNSAEVIEDLIQKAN